jgi:hypothetical protein
MPIEIDPALLATGTVRTMSKELLGPENIDKEPHSLIKIRYG